MQDDTVLLTAVDVRRDFARAEHRLERAADVAERDAEIRRLVAIDHDSHLRLALLVVRVDAHELRILNAGAIENTVAHARELIEVIAL